MGNEARWNKAAVASFVLPIVTIAITGVLGTSSYDYPVRALFDFVGISPLAGLALSMIAFASNKREQRGMNMAALGLILNGLMLVYLDPGPVNPANAARASCASNLKRVATALVMYSQDYDGHLPPRGKWNKTVCDAYKGKYILTCPEDKSGKASYAINRALINSDISRIDDSAATIMLYECTPGENRVGGVEMAEYRHHKGCNAGFVDGHINWLRQKDFRDRMSRNIETRKQERK